MSLVDLVVNMSAHLDVLILNHDNPILNLGDFPLVPEEVLTWASHALGLNPHLTTMTLHQVWCLDLECNWCD